MVLALEQLIRYLVILIFVSTSYSKLFHKEKHIESIRNYNIIPNKYINVFFNFIICLELMTIFGLLTKLFIKFTIIISITLVIMYTSAIIINLLRGRRDISCGCGGIVGNDLLSWWLVLRNMFLLGLCNALLYFNSTNNTNYSAINELFFTKTYIVLLMDFSLILFYSCLSQLRSIAFKFKEFSALKS